MSKPNFLSNIASRYTSTQAQMMSLDEYLKGCKSDKMYYATAAERMLKAIGDPVIVDTRNNDRLSRLHSNQKIKTYPESFGDFFGMEVPIAKIVDYFKFAAQGLEESKQILYLLGPVGGGKSSLAERLKELMTKSPIYTIQAENATTGEWETSPILESPLGLFDKTEDGDTLHKEFGIPIRYLGHIMSPWAVKRLEEAKGDISKFKVVRIFPSVVKQIAITKVEPGDENNQDISSLVGKVNIRSLDEYDQDDPDAYAFSGGLNVAAQGLLEFVEMFKAPLKMLHPLLTATQEQHYNGTEQFGAMPFQGIILAHSNESEWADFRGNSNNEAFLDRVAIVRVPYCLQVTEERDIYKKLLKHSDLTDAPRAPGTLEMMAKFSVLTRLTDPANSEMASKLRVYNGENVKNDDPKAKSLEEYRDAAGINEGMSGSSTRFAFKTLSKVFNFGSDEIAGNPIHLMYVLTEQIKNEQMSKDQEETYLAHIKGILAVQYADYIEKELQQAYVESYDSYGQNIFDRYVQFADYWIQDKDYRDESGMTFNRDALDEELKKIERSGGVNNNSEFRSEVVNFVLREKSSNGGKIVKWTAYEKLKQVIEKKMFASTDDLLPVISFTSKTTTVDEVKHADFVKRMVAKGYTPTQVRLVVDWYMRYKSHH